MDRKSIVELLGGVTRFGRLTVRGEAPPRIWAGRRFRLVDCVCDCGSERQVQVAKLKSGQTVSCGCHAADMTRARATHGMTGSPEYVSWQAMKSRCYDSTDIAFARYGGRGIRVCDEWRHSFEAFFADMGRWPISHSIEREDVDGNYEPSNCRWATALEQADNTRVTHHIEVGGDRVNLSEASRRSGLSRSALRNRLAKGWTPDRAVSEPRDLTQGARRKSNNRHVEYQGRSVILAEVAERTGIDSSHLNYHLKRGRTADEAVALILARRGPS